MSTTIFTYGGKVLVNAANNKWLKKYVAPAPVDPYNPLGLPANTVRVRTSDGNPPTIYQGDDTTSYETATLVTGTADVYDVYKSGDSFNYFLLGSRNVVEVLGANTTGITSMQFMFSGCSSLTSVALFDTSSVTNMSLMFNYCSKLTSVPLFNTSNVKVTMQMFNYCSKLTSVPLFDTSSVTHMHDMFYECSALTSVPLFDTSSAVNMNNMFYNCRYVESGALALYQQASSKATPPSYHSSTFRDCGVSTTTGRAELDQIPSGWK